jgi:hypothetical protein
MVQQIILLVINLLAKVMCDRIKFKKLPKGDWWLAEGKYSWDKRSVLTKGVFSFISDGWHLFDAVRNMSLILIVVLALGLPLWTCIIGYAVYGLLFNLLYGYRG